MHPGHRFPRMLCNALAAAALFAQCTLPAHSQFFSREWTWPTVIALVRERFPEVTHISTAELERRLKLPDAERPILLDARSSEEFSISHLLDGRPAFTESMAIESLAGTAKSHPVVVYCSVGYRSAELARKLAARGYTRVVNLEGSLFAWANEGRPTFTGTRAQSRVHPYDRAWGVLLKPELHHPAGAR